MPSFLPFLFYRGGYRPPDPPAEGPAARQTPGARIWAVPPHFRVLFFLVFYSVFDSDRLGVGMDPPPRALRFPYVNRANSDPFCASRTLNENTIVDEKPGFRGSGLSPAAKPRGRGP